MSMQKIDKLMAKAALQARAKQGKELLQMHHAISRMTLDQLRELVYEEPTDERVQEIFASVGYQL